MKYLKKFNPFVEKYSIGQNDPADFASDKNTFNQTENFVKEFLVKKVTLENIYVTYRDEKDLITKLFAQKFIPVNTSDKKKVQFSNPLFGLYAQALEKKRQLKSLEDDLLSQQGTLADRQTTINQNPDTKDSLSNDVQYTQSKISDINNSISRLKNEVVTLERNTQQKLKQMKIDILNNKKKIDYFGKTK